MECDVGLLITGGSSGRLCAGLRPTLVHPGSSSLSLIRLQVAPHCTSGRHTDMAAGIAVHTSFNSYNRLPYPSRPSAGGPALQGDMVAGVAFQNLPHADSIGYIIPTPVVRLFLAEVAQYGHYKGGRCGPAGGRAATYGRSTVQYHAALLRLGALFS